MERTASTGSDKLQEDAEREFRLVLADAQKRAKEAEAIPSNEKNPYAENLKREALAELQTKQGEERFKRDYIKARKEYDRRQVEQGQKDERERIARIEAELRGPKVIVDESQLAPMPENFARVHNESPGRFLEESEATQPDRAEGKGPERPEERSEAEATPASDESAHAERRSLYRWIKDRFRKKRDNER